VPAAGGDCRRLERVTRAEEIRLAEGTSEKRLPNRLRLPENPAGTVIAAVRPALPCNSAAADHRSGATCAKSATQQRDKVPCNRFSSDDSRIATARRDAAGN